MGTIFSPKLFLGILLIGLLAIFSDGQVSDESMRSFDDLRPILIDIDGDGVHDKLHPRTHQTYKRRPGERLLLRNVTNWIVFDLETSRGFKRRSAFAYKYGTAEVGGSYWVYSLVSTEDMDGDGLRDLVFYSGDDTSDETIEILVKGDRLVVHSRKVTTDW